MLLRIVLSILEVFYLVSIEQIISCIYVYIDNLMKPLVGKLM